jgi:putative hydrolase of the HAD superfamily
VIDAVVFDLTGVLLDFQGPDSLNRLSRGAIGRDTFMRFWSEAPCADAFYRGACSPLEFADGAVAAFGLTMSPTAFLDEFRSWLRGPYPGAFELLEQVRRRATVACLSNTNSVDVARFRDELDFDRRFDHCFFSNEIGHRKPDPAIYAHLLDRLGLSEHPERVVFVDDSPACVDGARRAGMLAYETAGVAEVRARLDTLALLSD